jgi:hypothetical protein
MRILLASPLYPPDIAEPAPYVKELALRLSASHSVTVLTYGKHPETIERVRMHSVDKSTPRLVRLKAYTRALGAGLASAAVVFV